MTYETKALPLLHAGFTPIPLDGKRPVVDHWQSLNIDEQIVSKWAANGYANHNVGVRTDHSHAIDVDIYDAGIARAIARWLDENLNNGEPFVRRFGQYPKFLIPCHIDGVSRKLKSTIYIDSAGREQAIEILSVGQQYAVDGTHPDTGKPYTWVGGDLADMGLLGLPDVAADDISMLFDRFDELAENAGWEIKSSRKTKPTAPRGSSADPFADYTAPPPFEEVVAAVEMLPAEFWDDYDNWVEAGMAIHWSTNGSLEGFDLWDRASRQSDKYAENEDKNDTQYKWKSFSGSKPPGEVITFATLYEHLRVYFSDAEIRESVPGSINVVSYSSQDSHNSPVSEPELCEFGCEAACDRHSSHIVSASGRGVYGEVDEYIRADPAGFTVQQIYQELGYTKKAQKDACRKALSDRVKAGVIKKDPMKRGAYVLAADDLETMSFTDTKEDSIPLRLPLGLSNYYELIPGNVIIIGGSTNAGKTVLAMNLLKVWIGQLVSVFESPLYTPNFTPSLRESTPRGWPESFVENFSGIRYLNSEMSEIELGRLVKKITPDPKEFFGQVHWVKRNHNYAQAILKNGITVVDFMQIHDEFYKIGGYIKDIAEEVGTGLVVILIQMQRGAKFPRGGDFALERCRLGLLLDRAGPGIGSCLIAKGKNVKDGQPNPQDAYVDYKFGDYLQLKPVSDLMWLDDKQREKMNKGYKDAHKAEEAKKDFEEDFAF